MAPPMVIAELVNRLADLQAWGRDPAGVWWALVSWELYVQLPGGNGHVRCSAWLPATTIRRSNNPEEQRRYPDVPRLALSADVTSWPPAAPRQGIRSHDYGRITAYPAPPAGLAVLDGRRHPGT